MILVAMIRIPIHATLMIGSIVTELDVLVKLLLNVIMVSVESVLLMILK